MMNYTIEAITKKLADYDAAHGTECGKEILFSFLSDSCFDDVFRMCNVYDREYEQEKKELNVTEIKPEYQPFELLTSDWEVKE